MTKCIMFSSIVEKNGKTIYENNMEVQHNIPVGTLVEVTHDNWYGDGCCEKIHGRYWVVSQSRDCDGTPLYYLSTINRPSITEHPLRVLSKVIDVARTTTVKDMVEFLDLPEIEALLNTIYHSSIGGFPEDSLTVVEITDEIKKGKDSLTWE